MRSLDSLQLSQHPRGIRNGEIPHRSWAGLKSPSKDDRHEDVKQKPVITFPKTPQACAPNIISHKQEFHIGKDIYDTGGWVPLEDVPTQSDMLLSTPKSLKQQKDYFRAFISHKNVHRSLNRREELLPYLNSKIAVYRQYPLGYIPTHHHQVLNVGSNAVESDTSPAAIHYGKAIKHKSALDPISLQSLADMHKPTKNKTISKVTQTILEKKTKHVHSAMKSVAHEAKNKANLNAEHDNGTAHAPIQKQITSLTPFELPEGIEEANPKQALRSLAPPKPLLRSTSKTTQFVRPGVPERAEQSKPMPKKTVEKPSVQVPARPKYKESSIDDEVPTTPPVRRKKSLKQSMLLVPEERGISDSNEIVDTAESVTRIVKLKKKRASKKSLVSSTSIENVENVSSTCLVSKEKRKSDPKVSNDIQKTSSETILKQKNIQQILVSKTVDKKSGAPTTRPAGESNSVRAPLPKIKPPPKAAALMKKAKEESAIINDILQAEPSNEGFLASLLKKMNLVDEDSKNRINGLISPMFTAKKLISPKEIGARLKGMGNLRDITDREIEYIKRIFELVNSSGVTEDEFCVVVALAERMTMMNMSIRLSFYDTDFAKLESQIKQFRSLFTVFAQDEGVMTYEDLRILLLSTGVNDAQIAEIAVLLNFKDALPDSPVKFLDFLTYIPFFTQLHQSIVDDPFGNRGSMTSLLK